METSPNNEYIKRIRAERMRDLMELCDLTGKDIAEKLNYTPQHISYVLNGKRNMTTEMAIALADLFTKHSVFGPTGIWSIPYTECSDAQKETLKIDYKYLLGESDYMRVQDKLFDENAEHEHAISQAAIRSLLHRNNYDFDIDFFPITKYFRTLKPNDTYKFNEILQNICFDERKKSTLTKMNTGETVDLLPWEVYHLFLDIEDAVLSIINREFEKKKWLNTMTSLTDLQNIEKSKNPKT